MASRAPEMGNLQRKLEKLETLKPRLQYDMEKVDEALRPLPPVAVEAPEPAPVSVRVAPRPQPQPLVVEMPAQQPTLAPVTIVAPPMAQPTIINTPPSTGATAMAAANSPVGVPGGSPGDSPSIQDLATNALDSIRMAGGNPELENRVTEVTRQAMSAAAAPNSVADHAMGYSKIGGSGPQASL